jgi:hypothetical protein
MQHHSHICLFSPHFAFSYEGAEHHINHNAFHGLRNASNIIIKFRNLEPYFFDPKIVSLSVSRCDSTLRVESLKQFCCCEIANGQFVVLYVISTIKFLCHSRGFSPHGKETGNLEFS